MPLTERPTDNDVRSFLDGKSAKPRTNRNTVKERSYLLRLPADEMARIKSIAARRGETMKEFMAHAIIKACEEEE
ncbi:MAG: hypothetical protein IJG43_07845 [Acidaminococcaceae bacterium]|jgi:predicted DNA binding CopG/RHH family protein|nr:hypothetical protein [Acidaminococcaceae bacterium]